MLKDHSCADLQPKLDKKSVKLAGFVHAIRKHGSIVFIDLRDSTGLCQIVVAPEYKQAYKIAESLGVETIIQVAGKVKKRPKGSDNPKLVSGKVEIEAEDINVLSKAKTPVFELDKDTINVNEEKRLQYRYLDLRSNRMKKNLELRHNINNYVRDFLSKQGFLEVETPYLTKGTPEGAREYVVPSRIEPGKFYVLPQSPQQFKQLLMVSGVEKYFQLVRCFRDEDQRKDRQAEFTQLDIEMAYVTEEDIMILIEQLMTEMVEDLFPKKKLLQSPFPVMSYNQAIKDYGTDRPDIRKNKNDPNELAFCWVKDFPLMEYKEKTKELTSTHHPFTKPRQEDIKLLDTEPEKVKAEAYDLVLNGWEIFGGSIRISDPKLQFKIFQVLGLEDKVIKERFGHMIQAFEYGVPPHGGIASGHDRLVALLAGEKNIREAIAFPKTGDGRDLMMQAPSAVDPKSLKELHIKTDIKKK